MASTEAPPRPHDRHGRRRPFTTWMRRLASLKTLHTDSNAEAGASSRRYATLPMTIKSKKGNIAKNNPYPLSSRISEPHSYSNTTNGHLSFSTHMTSSQRSRHSSFSQSHSKHSVSISHDSQTGGNKSRAPTLATQAETALSDAAPSGAGTSATAATKTDGGRDSTFSSPAPSIRSMATTLTTVQSIAAPSHHNNNNYNNPGGAPMLTHTSTAASNPVYYGGQPATAVPAHLAPHSHPTTYHSAIANNVLTDDASILTLASSSKRRRRNSVDTNASIKALAPASMFGGSRESLPLSVLSGTVIHPSAAADTASLRGDAAAHNTRSNLNAERSSLISASGVTAPALASERNSYIGSKYGGDSASVRSNLLGGASAGGHGRNDSLSGSIGGGYREKEQRDKEKEKERDNRGMEKVGESENENANNISGMVTAPTSPLVDGQHRDGAGETVYISASALEEVTEALEREKDKDDTTATEEEEEK